MFEVGEIVLTTKQISRNKADIRRIIYWRVSSGDGTELVLPSRKNGKVDMKIEKSIIIQKIGTNSCHKLSSIKGNLEFAVNRDVKGKSSIYTKSLSNLVFNANTVDLALDSAITFKNSYRT